MPFLDLPPWMISALLAPFGLVVGSFGNVLIHRLPQEEPADRNVITKASHCPGCKAKIKPWHNVPLFGWLWLRGRCAACGWRIPLRYPLVELLGGLLFAVSPWIFPVGSLIWFKGLICGFALIVLFFTDFTEMMLPDVLQFPLMGLGILFTLPQIFRPETLLTIWTGPDRLLQALAFHNGLQPSPAYHGFEPAVTWSQSLIGLAVGYGVPALMNQIYKWIRKTDGLGMGDFKMLAWLGAFWGWGPMLGILFLGAGLGTAVGLPLMLLRRSSSQTMLPFGCFLALATPVVVFFGRALWLGYLGWMG
ncbi:type 4 prepilin-like proteins leader peptide-processing enzyme [Geothrix limicola]|uniref:Type 4 prepilin-like proteins leader peptide-processing enzyme n=1 Tax=Geothrix limicola TaxID=2927978 RepID=A0ABQ5QE20_9BACT|nr:A24 family peptidase [Geothrix limicola]GLH72813.1 type 4 prepilin-like proteins leader peptide-processing enzyme [Geothrix limicola]